MIRVEPLVFPALLCTVALWCGTSCAEDSDQPNIVILLADDLGYGELGCQGNSQIPTPNIDSIAKHGVRFTAGYVSASYCSASRAGLLTGRIQTRFGHEFNPIGAKNEDAKAGLPATEQTLAQVLHDAGYTTALFGKWHLGGTAAFHPHRRGFDEFFGFLHEGHYFVLPPWKGVTTMLRRRTLPGGDKGRWANSDKTLIYSTHMGYDEPAYDADNPILRGGQPVAETEYLTDAFTREATGFIRRTKDRPFFLLLAYNAVHSPLQGAAKYMKKFEHIEDIHRRIFAAMLANLDDSVGAVMKTLRDERLDQRTIVFFLSDNGGPTRELTSSNAPLRGEKGSVYEGGIRVPFMVQWPGTLPRGEVYNKPVTSLDVFTTSVALARAQLPRKQIDGVNLMPYLLGEKSGRPHEVLFWRQGRRTAVRVGDFKLLRNPGRGQDDDWQLYNLASDLAEATNLAESHSKKRAELFQVWQKLNGQMVEPLFR
jgi:arylsulfatase B